MPVYRDIKVLDSGAIGQPEIAVLITWGRGHVAAYSPRWRHRAADSGGGVLMIAHVVTSRTGSWTVHRCRVSLGRQATQRRR
jgi:hypothetical protein